MSISEIIETLFSAEEKYGLLDVNINGVKVWQALRHHYYLKIAIELGVFTQPHGTDHSHLSRWKTLGRVLKSTVFNNPFFSKRNIDILILDHPRKVKVNNEYIDIYTKYFIDDLIAEGKSFEVLEKPDQNRHLSPKALFRKHADSIQLLSLLTRPFIKIEIDPKTEKVLSDANLFLNNKLGISLDLLSECQDFTKLFASQKHWIDKLLARKNPQQMYIVAGFAYAVWVQAAKEKGVEVIELQHGVMSRYYIGYSYPNSIAGSISVFPDKLLVWNDYWKKMAPYPLAAGNIEIKKFEFFEREKAKYMGYSRDKNHITIISQGTVTARLAKLLLKNADALANYQITYKLHPGEFSRWKNYPALVELSKLNNVEIIKNEKPLYELFAKSKYLIGIYSTALFEGLEFGCKVMVADLPGIEHIKPMIENDSFIKIENENIIQAVDKCDD